MKKSTEAIYQKPLKIHLSSIDSHQEGLRMMGGRCYGNKRHVRVCLCFTKKFILKKKFVLNNNKLIFLL